MVFVSVRNKYSAQFGDIFLDIGKIRDDQIHPEHVMLGKSHATVDDDHIVSVFINIEIFGYSGRTGESYKFEAIFHMLKFICSACTWFSFLRLSGRSIKSSLIIRNTSPLLKAAAG